MPATYSSSAWTANSKLVQLVAHVYKKHKAVDKTVSTWSAHARESGCWERALTRASVRFSQKYKNTISELGNQYGLLINHAVLKRAVRTHAAYACKRLSA